MDTTTEPLIQEQKNKDNIVVNVAEPKSDPV